MTRRVNQLLLLSAGLLAAVLVLDQARRPAPVLTLCGVLAVLLAARHRGRPAPERARQRGVLVLSLLLLPTLVQFHLFGGRINGDGVMYYVYVRSMAKDADLELTNEYTHYGLIEREDLKVPTRTGRRRSIFAVGPALAWLPFFGFGEAVGRVAALARPGLDLSGYGPVHVNAVALGSLLLGFAAVRLIHQVLTRHFSAGVALGAALLTWLATFLHWYMVHQPTMSHAPSAFGAALAVWYWDRHRCSATLRTHAVLGLILGLGMCLRWQNAVLLVLPGFDLVRAWRRDPGSWPALGTHATALGTALLLGALPQLAAWKILYGEWLLRYPPHGADFLRLSHPFVLETLFSSRHGLLSWTPILWLGYLGFLPLARRRPQLAFPLLLPLVLMTYVNMCSGDWWAGGSFSNRRFDSLLPVLACGMGAALDVLVRALSRAPSLALAALVIPALSWNGLVLAQLGRGLAAAPDPIPFPRLVGGASQLLADHVGSPRTWPASWIFAWRFDRPPSQYDRLVGRYLFYRQNNLGGHLELGRAGDDVMLGGGWGPPEQEGEVDARRILGRARLFAPLDVPEEIEVAVRSAGDQGESGLEVEVNGRPVGALRVPATWHQPSLRVPARFWKRELNEVVLVSTGAPVRVDAVDFTRVVGGADSRGFRAR
jgi:hypothetical protein